MQRSVHRGSTREPCGNETVQYTGCCGSYKATWYKFCTELYLHTHTTTHTHTRRNACKTDEIWINHQFPGYDTVL